MNTSENAKVTFVEIALFILIAPVFLVLAGSGPLRASGQPLSASLLWDFLAGLIYFGPAIIGAALISTLVSVSFKRASQPWRAICVVGAPVVFLPIAVALLLALEARRGAPLINQGSPYVYIAAPAGLVIGVLMALMLRRSEERASRTPAAL